MSNISGKVRLLSINKFNILSWYIKDRKSKESKVEKLKEYIIRLSKVKKI